MVNHYITTYHENGSHWVEAWLQINLFGKCICFSRRKIEIEKANPSANELTKKCIPFDCKAFAKAVAVANCDKD